MLATISVLINQKKILALPASALLYDGNGSKVWVENSDGSFSSRTVKIGPGNSRYKPIESGLSFGDVVVSNGAYLLNSDYIFMNGQGIKDMDPTMKIDKTPPMDPNMKM